MTNFFCTIRCCIVAFAARLNFLQEAFEVHGNCKWHMSMDDVAERFGIKEDKSTGRSGSIRLGFEMR